MYGVCIRKKCKTLQAKRIVFIIHLSKGGVIYDGKEKKKTGNARHPDHRSIRCTSGGDSFMDHSIRKPGNSKNQKNRKNQNRNALKKQFSQRNTAHQTPCQDSHRKHA